MGVNLWLIKALGNEEFVVREKAALALGTIGDPIAIPALEELSSDENPYVRNSAEDAMKSIMSKNR